MEISRKRCRRTTMSSPRHDTDVRHSRADSRGSDSLARQALADHVELVERGESERQRALAAAAILARDAEPQQFGQMPLDRHDVWLAPDAVHALLFEQRPPSSAERRVGEEEVRTCRNT